jgi:hypothetical protein
MPQLKPRLNPMQIERLREARQRLGRGAPILYPEKGLNQETQLAVLERLKRTREKTLISEMNHRKTEKIRKKIMAEMRPAFLRMTREEKRTVAPQITRTLKSELARIPFPETKREAERVERSLRMYRKGKGLTIKSSDYRILNRSSRINAVEIATRFATRELLETARQAGLNQEGARALESILNIKNRPLKGTKINISPPFNLLLLRFVNAAGEERAAHAVAVIGKRTEEIQKEAQALRKQTGNSDVFININQKVFPISGNMEYMQMDRAKFAKNAWKNLMERVQAIETAKRTNPEIPKKLLDRMGNETTGFMIDIQTYVQNHNIPASAIFS